MSYRDHLRSDAATLEIGDALRASPRVLLGVGPFAVNTLASMGITSVFDLATASVFGAADLIVRAAGDPVTPEARIGKLPADLFASPNGVALSDAPGLDVDALRALGGALAGNVREALDVSSIRELALWPPYLAAKEILAEATTSATAVADGTPGDLLPMSGRYATERAFYSTFVLADVDDPGGADKRPLEDAGPLDPAATVGGQGFTRPARGARLTFSQSWFSEGVALGQLLHSLALAPGESTRVAMIDWSRQQTGTQAEREGQTEMLVGDITRKRALSEVQSAVASETQSGFSTTNARSSSMQGGGGAGIGIGALTLGGSFSGANAQSSSSTVTGTSGVRNVAAAMSQNVADSTHQAASSARDRFASVVRELSQSEHEQLSTRVVANYNHMHSLTVQYYEVVQIFRTVVGLHRFEPCLFVPMKLVDFLSSPGSFTANELLVRRFRGALAAAALDPETAMQLRPEALGLIRAEGFGSVGSTTGLPADVEAAFEAQAARLRQAFGFDPVVRDGAAMELSEECQLTGVVVDFAATKVQLRSASGGGVVELTPAPVAGAAGRSQVIVSPSNQVSSLTTLSIDTGGTAQRGLVTLQLSFRGTALQVPLPVQLVQTPGYQVAVQFRPHQAPQALLRRLQEEQLYYSQVIWRALDPAAVATLLAPYTYAGQPLAQVVNPVPIEVSGNLLVFRMPWEARDLLAADETTGGALGAVLADAGWVGWVRRHADFASTVEDLVPLPSGGVFAEAVLGRSNSAEKLDITRFWNWLDSPVPLQAPDIAALQAGSRARDDTTTPSGLAAPVVAFNNPPALPDPAGLAGVLGAVANGGLFRDMSGASVTQALAQAALQQAVEGSTAAGAQAAANLAQAAQKEIEMAKIAAQLVGGGLAGPAGSVSEQGARINQGRSLDERAVPDTAADPTPSHEALASEGNSGRVLDLVGKVVKPAQDAAPAAPPPSSGSSSAPATPPAKPPAPAPKPAPKPPAPKK